MKKNPAAVELGRKGGQVKSPAKAKSSAANGKLGGRPKNNNHSVKNHSVKKKLTVIMLCLFTLTGFAADYTYAGDPITKRTYNTLFRRFKTKLFVLSDGEVISLVKPNGETPRISFLKKHLDSGEITGKIIKIVDKNTFILKAHEVNLNTKGGNYCYIRADGKTIETIRPKTFTVAVSGTDTSKLFQGDDFTSNVVLSGAYDNEGQRLRKFAVLKPITEPEFREYLAAGNELYIYRKKLAGHTPCEKCQGKGRLPNPNYKKGKLASRTITCKACKYGKIPIYKYTKIAIKPKRKKIASR